MRRFIPIAAAVTVLAGVIATATAVGVGQPSPTTPAAKTPRWVTHVARYQGGISGGVRAMLAASQARTASPASAQRARPGAPAGSPGNNVQMNDDSTRRCRRTRRRSRKPGQPQVAVAAANDYVSGGNVVMRTLDGGRPGRRRGSRRSSAAPGTSARAGTRRSRTAARPHVLHGPAVLLPRAAVLRGPGLHVGRQRPARGRPAVRPRVPRPTSTTPPERSTCRSSTTRSYIAVDNTPTSPHYGRHVRHVHEVPHAAERVQRLLPAPACVHRLVPTRTRR